MHSPYKNSQNLLFNLQFKTLARMRESEKTVVKFNFLTLGEDLVGLNYFDYPKACRRLVSSIFKPGHFFGVGLRGYYSSEASKKFRLIN